MQSQSSTVPPTSRQSASLNSHPELGALVSRHPCSYFSYLVVGVVLTLPGLFCLWSYITGQGIEWSVGAGILLPGGLGCLAWTKVLAARSVSCYQQGFVDQRGSKSVVVRWKDVDTITQRVVRQSVNFVPVGTSYTYHVQSQSGKRWKFDNQYQNVAQLGQQIHQGVVVTQLPILMQLFRSGKPVSFGKLVFDGKGISYNRAFVPWGEYRSIDYDSGYLRVHKQNDGVKGALTGGTIVVHITGLPNFYLLDAFVRQLGR